MNISILQSTSKTDLEKMTKTELIAGIIGDQSKTECIKSVDGKNGQELREFVNKDATGKIIQTDQWIWTYKETGEVNEIIHIVLDGKSAVLDATKVTHIGKPELVKMDLKEVSMIAESIN
jgi:hypothetical protein